MKVVAMESISLVAGANPGPWFAVHDLLNNVSAACLRGGYQPIKTGLSFDAIMRRGDIAVPASTWNSYHYSLFLRREQERE